VPFTVSAAVAVLAVAIAFVLLLHHLGHNDASVAPPPSAVSANTVNAVADATDQSTAVPTATPMLTAAPQVNATAPAPVVSTANNAPLPVAPVRPATPSYVPPPGPAQATTASPRPQLAQPAQDTGGLNTATTGGSSSNAALSVGRPVPTPYAINPQQH
jgi:hypothetical protein